MNRSDRVGATQRSQSGSVLLASLAAMIVGTILLAALLSLVSSTALVEQSNVNVDRQIRAAEGALGAAITQIRNTPGVASATGDPCEPFGAAPPVTLPNGNPGVNPTRIEVDGVRVIVSCTNQGLSGPEQVTRDDEQFAVRLVGDKTYGDFEGVSRGSEWRTTSWLGSNRWNALLTAIPGGPTTSQVGTEMNNTPAQLVHVGAKPMRVVGGVQVTRESAMLRTDGGSPAVDVEGTFLQEGDGLFPATTTRGADPQIKPCGVIERTDVWGAGFTDVAARPGAVPVGSDDNAVCDGAAINYVSAGTPPPPLLWTNRSVQERRNQITGNTGLDVSDCKDIQGASGFPAQPVVTLEGAFDAAATKKLNEFFRSCDATWVFLSDVWFDVFDPTKPDTDPRRHSLVLDTPPGGNSNFIFASQNALPWLSSGQRPAWSNDGTVSGSFTDACSRTPGTEDKGGSITLSSRTGLRHNNGRVLVCGVVQPGNAYPKTAIFQRTARGLGAVLEPTQLDQNVGNSWRTQPGGSTDLTAMANNVRRTESPPQSIRFQFTPPNCSGFIGCFNASIGALGNLFGFNPGNCAQAGTCVYERSFRVKSFQTTTDLDPSLRVTDAKVEVQGSSENIDNGRQYLRLDVTLPSPLPACYVEHSQATGTPTKDRTIKDGRTIVVDLLASNRGTCASVFSANNVTNGQLASSLIIVKVGMNPRPDGLSFTQIACGFLPWLCNFFNIDYRWKSFSVDVDRVNVTTDWSPTLRPTNLQVDPVCSYSPTDDRDVLRGNCTVEEGNAGGINFTNTTRVRANDGQDATAQSFSTSQAFARLRFDGISDDNLVDGFLPVGNLRLKLDANAAGLDTANSSIRVVVRFARSYFLGITQATGQPVFGYLQCATSVQMSQYLANPSAPIEVISNGVLTGEEAPGQPRCKWVDNTGGPPANAVPPVPSEVAVGDLTSWTDTSLSSDPINGQSTDLLGRERVRLDVVFNMVGGSGKSVAVDHVQLTATTKTRADGSYEFTTPEAPISVRSNQLPLNAPPALTPRPGDASFTVFGSTVVPDNAVEVRWGSGYTLAPSLKSGNTGYGIFNGGSVPSTECSAVDRTACRPGLVAGALASWTTEASGDETGGVAWDPAAVLDPVATSGSYQPARRNVWLRACVVTSPGGDGVWGTGDDETRKRARADVSILDRSANKQAAVGTEVRIDRFGNSSRDDQSTQIASSQCGLGAYDG